LSEPGNEKLALEALLILGMIGKGAIPIATPTDRFAIANQNNNYYYLDKELAHLQI